MYLFTLLVTAFITLVQVSILAKPTIVSLGEDCQVGWFTRKYDLRNEAHPFDWVTTPSLARLTVGFKEDFQYLLNPNYLRLASDVNLVINDHYLVYFIHDFPTNHNPNISQDGENGGIILANALEHLPFMEIKYNKRFQRLREFLESSEPVFFIRSHRASLRFPSCTLDEVRHFIDVIKEKYPQLQFLFVYAHDDPNLNFDWGIDGALNFFAQTHCNDGQHGQWFSDETWTSIFQQLNNFTFHKQ